jgi:hypothetical protein
MEPSWRHSRRGNHTGRSSGAEALLVDNQEIMRIFRTGLELSVDAQRCIEYLNEPLEVIGTCLASLRRDDARDLVEAIIRRRTTGS